MFIQALVILHNLDLKTSYVKAYHFLCKFLPPFVTSILQFTSTKKSKKSFGVREVKPKLYHQIHLFQHVIAVFVTMRYVKLKHGPSLSFVIHCKPFRTQPEQNFQEFTFSDITLWGIELVICEHLKESEFIVNILSL